MKRFLIAGALAFAAGGQAIAADLPPPSAPPPRAPATYVPAGPAYNWSGFYIGVNGGYGFASATGTTTVTNNTAGLNGAVPTSSNNINGFLVGGTVGANWQINALVLGLEADADWSGQQSTSSASCGAGCTLSESTKIPWLGTARLRAGYAFDRVLVYVTGGGAVTNFTDSLSANAGAGSFGLASVSQTAFGWTAGAGIEAAFAAGWSAKVEYLFVDTSLSANGTIAPLIGGGNVNVSAPLKDNLVRAGLNYKFW